jgi:TDG/mug DNA glycosylase family protein
MLSEFRQARPDLEAKVNRFAPRVVAFLGKRAYSSMMRKTNAAWGRQGEPFAGRPAWILPNPSGLNRITMAELVHAYSELRQALITSQYE